MLYNPYDWYWSASDGRIFSSARQQIVVNTDEGYLAALAGAAVTSWPRDAVNVQTSAALQEVLQPYNIFFELKTYAAYKRWQKEVGGTTVSGIPVATDDRSKLMVTGGRIAADANAAWTTTWQGADGNSYPLNAAAMIAISDAVQAHVSSCFAIYASVTAAIVANTVTTIAQVDAAFA